MLGVSTDTVRRLFGDERVSSTSDAVNPFGTKRRYRQLRIPDSVLDRVVNRKRVW